jgi:hypothetical protein
VGRAARSAADAVLNVTSNEHETITDPTRRWYDSSGYAVTRKPPLPSFFGTLDCARFQLGRSPSGCCRNFANRLVASGR